MDREFLKCIQATLMLWSSHFWLRCTVDQRQFYACGWDILGNVLMSKIATIYFPKSQESLRLAVPSPHSSWWLGPVGPVVRGWPPNGWGRLDREDCHKDVTSQKVASSRFPLPPHVLTKEQTIENRAHPQPMPVKSSNTATCRAGVGLFTLRLQEQYSKQLLVLTPVPFYPHR